MICMIENSVATDSFGVPWIPLLCSNAPESQMHLTVSFQFSCKTLTNIYSFAGFSQFISNSTCSDIKWKWRLGCFLRYDATESYRKMPNPRKSIIPCITLQWLRISELTVEWTSLIMSQKYDKFSQNHS